MVAVTSRGATAAALPLLFAAVLAAPAGAAERSFSEEDVAAAVKDVVGERTKDGAFRFSDPATGEQLSLVYDGIRIVRGLPRFGWFPNVNFHDVSEPKKKYALDFWLVPDGTRLKLMAIRVHKAPQPEGTSWMSITRAPLPWWWLPTIERASAVAGMQAWQVMGAIHERIANAKPGDAILPVGGNGKPLALEMIDVVQPVGREKADGRYYFACVEFRAKGTQLARYVADYWFEPKSRAVTFGRLEPQGLGAPANKAATEPRCDVGGAAFDVID